MAKEINNGYARVLKHRIKKQKVVSYQNFKDLCKSGHISKDEAKIIAEKSINEITKIVDGLDENIKS